jgi:alpha-1,6-mannosyltransferase
MHVCDINNFYSPTGGGVRTYHTHKLQYFLARGDVEYTLFLPSDRLEYEEHGPNVRVVHFPGVPLSNYRFIVDVPGLRRVLRDLSPDLIEVGSPYVLPHVVRAATSGMRSVLVGFWHADYPRAYVQRPLDDFIRGLGAYGRDVAWWYARQTYGRYSAVLAAADCVVDGLVENGIEKVYQTPLGVDTAMFDRGKRDQELRASVGAGDGRPLFFFPHRLIEEKGLSNVLGAWDAVYERHRPVLVFAGDGPRRHLLEAYMVGKPDVHYLGYVNGAEKMAAWYASADIVFALSAFETFGLSAAEAMASGCALVAANEGAAAELVQKSGGGVTVPYNDSAALSVATNALLASGEWDSMGRAAAGFVRTHFSWDAAFDRMVKFYEEIVDRGGLALKDLPRRWNP